MKKLSAFLLVFVLLAALTLEAGAEDGKLVYPGFQVQDSQLLLTAVPLNGGTVKVTADGVNIGGSASTLGDAQPGVTYYCVVDNSRSFSNYQKEQQLLGLNTLSDQLGEKDAMVLIPMGREVSFGEKLTSPDARREAIQAACTYDATGTNLYEAIDTVLKTVAQEEQGFRCIVFFTDGIDESFIMKVNEEQAGRFIQGSGMSVNFIALLTPPISEYAGRQAQRLEYYSTLALGGTCRTPLREGDGSVNAVVEPVQDIVKLTRSWTLLTLDADSIPRTGKTVELTLTWEGEDGSVTDTVTLNTADLPPLPETEPVTEPVSLPPTQPPETIPPITQPPEPIPEYQDHQAGQLRYYGIIGFSVIGVVILLAIVVVLLDKGARRKQETGHREPVRPAQPTEAAQAAQQPAQVLPPEPPQEERREEAPQGMPPQAVQPEEAPQEADPPEEAPEEGIRPAEIPTEPQTEEAPENDAEAQPEENPAEEPPELAGAPREQPVREEAPAAEAEEAAPVPQEPPAEAPAAAEEEIPEAEDTPAAQEPEYHGSFLDPKDRSSDIRAADPFPQLQEEPIIEKAPAAAPVIKNWQPPAPQPAAPVISGWQDAPARQSTPRQAAPAATGRQSAPANDFGTARIPGLFPDRRTAPAGQERFRPAPNRPTSPGSRSAGPLPVPPARPGAQSSITVRLTPDGNPGGTVYVTMEPGSSRTLGRNSKSDIILNARDTSLSGLHFELQWDGRVLYLTDRGSTNGTSLTGIPQRPGRWSHVDSGSTIQAGSTRYKVKIMRE